MAYSPTIEEIHLELLLLLSDLDAFCQENQINYSLHGGTLLGAIRNNGFIEWDDDADISMTRENFDKFIKIISSNPQKFNHRLDLSNSQRPMIWPQNSPTKVWIDVFVYDFISENIFSQKCKIITSVLFLALTKTPNTMKVFRKGSHRKGLTRLIVEFLYFLGKLFPQADKIKLWTFINIYLFNGSRKLIFRSNDQYIGLKKIVPSDTMERYVRVPFENISLMITSQYHEILLSCYGPEYLVPRKDNKMVIEAHKTYRNFNS